MKTYLLNASINHIESNMESRYSKKEARKLAEREKSIAQHNARMAEIEQANAERRRAERERRRTEYEAKIAQIEQESARKQKRFFDNVTTLFPTWSSYFNYLSNAVLQDNDFSEISEFDIESQIIQALLSGGYNAQDGFDMFLNTLFSSENNCEIHKVNAAHLMNIIDAICRKGVLHVVEAVKEHILLIPSEEEMFLDGDDSRAQTRAGLLYAFIQHGFMKPGTIYLGDGEAMLLGGYSRGCGR
jgi:hypothetical protein